MVGGLVTDLSDRKSRLNKLHDAYGVASVFGVSRIYLYRHGMNNEKCGRGGKKRVTSERNVLSRAIRLRN